MQFCGLLSDSTISDTSCHLGNEKAIYMHNGNTVIGWVSLMLCLKKPQMFKESLLQLVLVEHFWMVCLLPANLWFIKTEIWCEYVSVVLYWGWICPAHSRSAKSFLSFQLPARLCWHVCCQVTVLPPATQRCCFPEGLRENTTNVLPSPMSPHCPDDQKYP